MTVGGAARCEFETLVRRLAGLGYIRVDQVEDAGDFSVRGGIIDVFPSTEAYPVRIEFWGDEVESLRSFSAYSQRSLARWSGCVLYAAAEEEGAVRQASSTCSEPGRTSSGSTRCGPRPGWRPSRATWPTSLAERPRLPTEAPLTRAPPVGGRSPLRTPRWRAPTRRGRRCSRGWPRYPRCL